MLPQAPPKGLLFDYGGTLVEEISYDARSGHELLLQRATQLPSHITLDMVMKEVNRVATEFGALRARANLELRWTALARFVYDSLGIRFAEPMATLEMDFWKASVKTREMPGAREALKTLHECGIPIGVVSNCSFGQQVIRHELDEYGLIEHLSFVMVSSEYGVRKPSPLLFVTAAAMLRVEPQDIWFVGDRLDRDIAGAKAAGMTAVWFCPKKREFSDTPDMTVADWADFTHCFQTIRADGKRP